MSLSLYRNKKINSDSKKTPYVCSHVVTKTLDDYAKMKQHIYL